MIKRSPFAPLSKPWTPVKEQLGGVKFLLSHAAGGLLADPGVGKTSVTLAAFKVLKAKKMVRKMLLLAPLRPIYEVWPAERDLWTDFNGITMSRLHGPNKEAELREDTDIHLTNLEGLEWLLKVVKSKTPTGKTRVGVDRRILESFGYDMLCVDELSKFKEVSSQRWKALSKVIGIFGRRWGLSGSPASKNLEGLFGQCYILDEGRTFGPYVTKFRQTYFDQDPYRKFQRTIKEGAEKQIYARINPLFLRIAAKGLPPVKDNDIMVDLPPDVRKIYSKVENDYFAQLDEGSVVAANAGVSSSKLRQIANGGVYLSPDIKQLIKGVKAEKKWVNLHTEKVDALADLIDQLQGKPLLVAYDTDHDLDRLQRKLGKEVPYIGGGVNPKRVAELLRKWNAGDLELLLGHPQSIGHGLNMQGICEHFCWHSLTWDYEFYDQFIRRIRRRGTQAKTIFNHRIMVKDSIDQAITISLSDKATGQEALFKALTQYRRKRALETKYDLAA
ncbi:MAG: DEAD/DEAH box helicase [candidate division FCPU426 bacterium]